MSGFDRYATGYKAVLDQSLGPWGASAEPFADSKAWYAARLVGVGFAGKVLDFGCGVGLVSRRLKRYLPAASVNGYDESRASIELVDAELLAQGVFTSDRRDLCTDYDLIVVANVLHHVEPKHRQALCRDLYARLVPGGRLLVFEHNPFNPLTRWVVHRCPLDRDAILLAPQETVGHVRRGGFQSVNREYVTFFPRPSAWSRSIERWLGWCPLGAQYAVVGLKGGEGSPDDIIR